MSRITRNSCAGPSPQFAPIASAPSSTRRSATCDGEEPSSVRSSFVNVALTTTASDGAPARAAASACSISRRSVCVSTTNRSTPPSASAAAWSRYASNASSGLTRPYGARRTPSGPIEPATNRAPASRARAAAARLSSVVRAARPCVPSRNRFPPNVFVRTMSEPAWTNARWIWRIRCGSSTFSSSKHVPIGSPCSISDVPMPPSARSGRSARSVRSAAPSITRSVGASRGSPTFEVSSVFVSVCA